MQTSAISRASHLLSAYLCRTFGYQNRFIKKFKFWGDILRIIFYSCMPFDCICNNGFQKQYFVCLTKLTSNGWTWHGAHNKSPCTRSMQKEFVVYRDDRRFLFVMLICRVPGSGPESNQVLKHSYEINKIKLLSFEIIFEMVKYACEFGWGFRKRSRR